ncbi:MAG: sulfatase, partial [Gammaproteobacteria bacterium]|nr:sulfatase [Gammaproteobacteria bacterium]
FDFSAGYPLLKLPAQDSAKRPPMQGGALGDPCTVLYDIESDPQQTTPVKNPTLEQELILEMQRIMREHHAPSELYQRFSLDSG